MNKEFLSASLKFTTVDPVTEKKTTVTLNDLTEDASADDVSAVRQALQSLVDEPIGTTQAVVTYAFA
ncbi:hypothetical protein HYQ40_07300 [Aerococcaceae bacterium DSM 111021]|nr:hypothetical protein [Aerococcaceae bacterium DSM 111021]